ncbi:unnamed protein product [Pocillopora meandrina]|uniref:Uncharacterized protein n=1 Tax=Pocillopora meandrina TaxID=46732 RepID=A0AAU9X5U9_9CNID|nr:unnamed protein product [Pocillopora meandrina]
MTGLWRNDAKGSDDGIYLIEYAKCCVAPYGMKDVPASCKTANWWGVLDSNNKWATCPDGYFMGGLYRTVDDPWLHNIEEARCCKPEGLPDRYADCYIENVWGSFDGKGLSECRREGYYMAGIFRGDCDKLYCLEEFKCCRMIVSSAIKNFWDLKQRDGLILTERENQYITGLWRNDNKGSNDGIYLIEHAKCCFAPYGVHAQDIPASCKKANCTNKWATCPDGYFMGGLYRTGKDSWLHNIEEARCCKPVGLPAKYADCYDENVWSSFDGKGLSECKRKGYYMAGIFRGECDKLYCLEKPIGCFVDSGAIPRPIPKLVANFRGNIDWHNLNKTVLDCARRVNSKGFRFFGIQFYGECWSGENAELTYNKQGTSKNCFRGLGERKANFVYAFVGERLGVEINFRLT